MKFISRWMKLFCVSLVTFGFAQAGNLSKYTPETIFAKTQQLRMGSPAELETFSNQVEVILGIQWNLHKCTPEASSYSTYTSLTGMNLSIYVNLNGNKHHLEKSPELLSLLYFDGGTPEEQFQTLVKLEDGFLDIKNNLIKKPVRFFLPDLKPVQAEDVGSGGLPSELEINPDLINVIDVESSCWDKNLELPEKVKKTQEWYGYLGNPGELIEIGITVINRRTFEIVYTESILVKPRKTSIGDFCTQLTTIDPSLIEKEGKTLFEAIKLLEINFDPRNRLFASYGKYDREMFIRECDRLGISYPFGSQHLNIKHAVEDFLNSSSGSKESIQMSEALAKLNIPLEGTYHRGADDSKNIAKILIFLLKREHPLKVSIFSNR